MPVDTNEFVKLSKEIGVLAEKISNTNKRIDELKRELDDVCNTLRGHDSKPGLVSIIEVMKRDQAQIKRQNWVILATIITAIILDLAQHLTP